MARISDKERSEVLVWRARIERAKVKRKEFQYRAGINLEYYAGHQWPHSASGLGHVHDGSHDNAGHNRITVNKIFSAIAADLPTLQYSNPNFNCTPRRPHIVGEGVDEETGETFAKDVSFERARAQSMALNYVFREIDAAKDSRLFVLAGKLAIGVLKVGFTGDVVEEESVTDILTSDPDRILVNEQYIWDWVHWDNMLFDPDGGNLFKNHRWVIEEWVLPLLDVKGNPDFKNRSKIVGTDRVGAKPGDEDHKPHAFRKNLDTEISEIEDDEARVRGFTIYDFEGEQQLTLLATPPEKSGGHDFFVNKDRELPEGMERGPYVFLKFYEKPGEWYPVTDVEQLIPLQNEYNETRSAILTHKRRADRKYIHTPGIFDGENGDFAKDSLQFGGDGSLVEVNDINSIKALEQPPMDTAFAVFTPLLQLDFNEIAGQSGEARGSADADTATQAAIIEGRGQLRENDRRDNSVQTAFAEGGRKLLQSMQANMDRELWVAMGDVRLPEPFNFKQISPDIIKAEFDIQVAVGSMSPQTTTFQRQQWQALMVTLSQNPLVMASRLLLQRTFAMYEVFDPAMLDELTKIGQAMLQAEQSKGQSAEQDGSPGPGTALSGVSDQIANRQAA